MRILSKIFKNGREKIASEVYRDELTLEDLLYIFKKRFWVFFVTLILTVALVVDYLILATPIYEASVSIKVEPQTQGSIADLFASQISSSRPDISTEVELIKSRRNIEQVIDELNLVDYFKNKAEGEGADITRQDVVNTVSEMISISPVKDTKIVKISVQSDDPVLAKNIANKLAEVCDEFLKSLSKNEYTIKRKFIEEQIPIEKLEETRIAEAGVVGTSTLVDSTIVPEGPVKPNKKLTLAIGGVLGIFLGTLLVFIFEYADKSIKDKEELKRIAKGKVILGRIPRFEVDEKELNPELVVLNKPTSPQSESIKLISTNINYSATPEPKVLSITSPAPKEGKTVMAANLAISYAQNGRKTLLLDLDMRRPRVEKALGIEKLNVGVVNHILKDVPLENITQNYMENLDVIPVELIPPNPTSLLTSKKFEQFMEKIKEKYEKIIIDLPPMLAAADSLIVSKE